MLSCVRLFATPWTVACQAPLSTGYPRQGYWSGSPLPSPGDLPDPGIEPGSPHCRWILYHLSHQGGKAQNNWAQTLIIVIYSRTINITQVLAEEVDEAFVSIKVSLHDSNLGNTAFLREGNTNLIFKFPPVFHATHNFMLLNVILRQ